jgi:hypothetical protein
MEPKFKKGEIVITQIDIFPWIPRGTIGKIKRYICKGYILEEFPNIMIFESELKEAWKVVQADGKYYSQDQDWQRKKIEPMKPIMLPKFKVGDRVRITKSIHFTAEKTPENKVGIITDVQKDRVCKYIYKLNNIPDTCLISELYLELIEEEEKEKEKDLDKRVSRARDDLLKGIFE